MILHHWATRFGLLVCLAWTAPACLLSATIELKTGDGAIGTFDPLVDFSTDWGATFQDSYIIATDPAYDIISGTHWISVSTDGRTGPQYSSNSLFRAVFDLPDGFSSPAFIISLHADNSARVFLNGTLIGEQPWDYLGTNFANWQDEPSIFAADDPALFLVGQNVLDVQLYNGLIPLGIDYAATISFIPESAATVRLTLSLMAVGLASLLRRRSGRRRQTTGF